ncbi:hypothetical protein PLESTF_000321500 [Pleodorina starrii]|nr:hypothetical protein PLESTF_000321500 [Pleodorina starrii]
MVLRRAPAAAGAGEAGDEGEVVQKVPLGDWMVAFFRRYCDPDAGNLIKKKVQVLWWNDPWKDDHDTQYKPNSMLGYGHWYSGRITSISPKTGHLEVTFKDGEVHDVALGVNFVHFGKRHPTGEEHVRLPKHRGKAAGPSHASGGGGGSVSSTGRGGRGRRGGSGAGALGTRGSTGGGSDEGGLQTTGGGADGGSSRPPSVDVSLQRLTAETESPGKSPSNGAVPVATMVATGTGAAGQGVVAKWHNGPGGGIAGAGSIAGGSITTPGSLRRSATPPISLAPNGAEAPLPSGSAPAERSDSPAVGPRPSKRPRLSDGGAVPGNCTAAAPGPAAAGPRAQTPVAPAATVSGSRDRAKSRVSKEAAPRETATYPRMPPTTVSTGGWGGKTTAAGGAANRAPSTSSGQAAWRASEVPGSAAPAKPTNDAAAAAAAPPPPTTATSWGVNDMVDECANLVAASRMPVAAPPATATNAAPTAGAQAAGQACGGRAADTPDLTKGVASRREQLQQPEAPHPHQQQPEAPHPPQQQQLDRADEGHDPEPAEKMAAVEDSAARDARAPGHEPTALHLQRTDANGGDGTRSAEGSTAAAGARAARALGAPVLEARQPAASPLLAACEEMQQVPGDGGTHCTAGGISQSPAPPQPPSPQPVLPPEQAPVLPRGLPPGETCTGGPTAEVRDTPMQLGGQEPHQLQPLHTACSRVVYQEEPEQLAARGGPAGLAAAVVAPTAATAAVPVAVSAPRVVHPDRLHDGSTAAGVPAGGSGALGGSDGGAGSQSLPARPEARVAQEADGGGGGPGPHPSPRLLGTAAAGPAASRGATAPTPAAAVATVGAVAAGGVDVCGVGRGGGVSSGGPAPGAAAGGGQVAVGGAAGRDTIGPPAGGAASAGAGAARGDGSVAGRSGGDGFNSGTGQGIGCERRGGGGGDDRTGSGGGGGASGCMVRGGSGIHGAGAGDGLGSEPGSGGFPLVPLAVPPPPELSPLAAQEWYTWWYVASSVGYSLQAKEVLSLACKSEYRDMRKASVVLTMEECCRQLDCVPLHLRVLQVQYIQHAYVKLSKVPQEDAAKLANQLLMLLKLFLHEAVPETQRLEAEARMEAAHESIARMAAAAAAGGIGGCGSGRVGGVGARAGTPPLHQAAQQQQQAPVLQSTRGLSVEEFWHVVAACACHCMTVIMLAMAAERSEPGRSIPANIQRMLPPFAELLRWGASRVPADRDAAAAAVAIATAANGEVPPVPVPQFALPRHLSLLPRFDATLKSLAERSKARKAVAAAAVGGAQRRQVGGEGGLGASGGSTGVPVASARGPASLPLPQGGRPQQQYAAAAVGGLGRELPPCENAEPQQLGLKQGLQADGLQLRPAPAPAARWRIPSRQLYSILLRAGSRRQTPADSEPGSTSDSETEAEAGEAGAEVEAAVEGDTHTRTAASSGMSEPAAGAPDQAHPRCLEADGRQLLQQSQGQRDHQGRQLRDGGEHLSRAALTIAAPSSAAVSGVHLDSADVRSAIPRGAACPPGPQAVAEAQGQAQAVGPSAGAATAGMGAAVCPAGEPQQREDPTRLGSKPLAAGSSSGANDRSCAARPPDCWPPPGGGGGSSVPPLITAAALRRARRNLALGNWVDAACTAAAVAEKQHTPGLTGAGAPSVAAAEAGTATAQPCTAAALPSTLPAPTVASAALPTSACDRRSPAPAEVPVQAQLQALPGSDPYPDLDPALVTVAAFDAFRLVAHMRGLLSRHLLQQVHVRQGGAHGPSAASEVGHAAGKTAAGVAAGGRDGPHPGPPDSGAEAPAGAAAPSASRSGPVPAAASGTATAEALTCHTGHQAPTREHSQQQQQEGTGSKGAGEDGSQWGGGQQRRLERLLAVVGALPPARLRALYLVSCRLAHGPGAVGGWWAVELTVKALEELADAAEKAQAQQALGSCGGGGNADSRVAAPAAATGPAPASVAAAMDSALSQPIPG